MHHMRAFSLAIAVVALTTAASAQTAAKLFNDSCSACHSIGGGDLVGPDLIKVAHKPRADVEKAVKRMQDNTGPLKPDQISALVDFLQSANAKEQLAAASKPSEPVIEIAPEQKAASSSIGAQLFFGETAFTNRGVPCLACHTVSGRGGNLAADLTGVITRRTDTALLTTAQQPGFPMMKAAYGEHAITKQEAYHLLAFFHDPPPPMDGKEHYHGIAGGIAVAVLAGVAVIVRSRRAGIRSRMVRK